MRGQDFGTIRKPLPDISPPVLVEDSGSELSIPEYLNPLALGVIRNARKTKRLKISSNTLQRFNKPRPATNVNKTSLANLLGRNRFCHFP
jgi:hypothetical protein